MPGAAPEGAAVKYLKLVTTISNRMQQDVTTRLYITNPLNSRLCLVGLDLIGRPRMEVWRESGIHNMPVTCFSYSRLPMPRSIVTTFLTTNVTSVAPHTRAIFVAALPHDFILVYRLLAVRHTLSGFAVLFPRMPRLGDSLVPYKTAWLFPFGCLVRS